MIKTGREAILYFGNKLYGDRFSLNDPATNEVYRKVYTSIIGGKAAANAEMDPSRAILMIGDFGVGKTWLWTVMQQVFKNTKHAFLYAKAKDILAQAKDPDYGHDWAKWYYGTNCLRDLYIDDIGIGQADINSYGNWSNILHDILLIRYEMHVNHKFKTHLSSNVMTKVPADAPPNVKSLERILGERILDRLGETSQLIVWKGKSKRG